MNEMNSRQKSIHFNRIIWLDDRGLLSRKILFMDLNYWIGMSEGKDPIYVELKGLVSEKVGEGKIVCPVSPSLLVEVKKRPKSRKRDEYCCLMDELSLGLAIRAWPVIFKDEFVAVIEEGQIANQIAFSHIVESFSAGLSVVFDNEWSDVKANQAANLIFNHLNNVSVADLVNIEMDQEAEGSVFSLRDGLSELARKEKEWHEENPDQTWDSIEHPEFAATVRAVLPQILSSPMSMNPSSRNKLIFTTMDEKREILNQCPTFWCQYKLITALRSNKSEINENDLWDLLHAASALPYVDCIACDKGTRHLCREVLHLDEKYGTAIVSTPAKLVEWLQNNVNAS